MEVMDVSKKTASSIFNRVDVYMDSEICDGYFLGKGNKVYPINHHWVYQPHFRDEPIPNRSFPVQNGLHFQKQRRKQT